MHAGRDSYLLHAELRLRHTPTCVYVRGPSNRCLPFLLSLSDCLSVSKCVCVFCAGSVSQPEHSSHSEATLLDTVALLKLFVNLPLSYLKGCPPVVIVELCECMRQNRMSNCSLLLESMAKVENRFAEKKGIKMIRHALI